MTNRIALLAALLVSATSASGATYSAKPVVPATQSRITVRDISWACGPAACQGATDYGRPVVLCEALAQRVGRIDEFVVDGRTLASAELERCNRAAAPLPAPSLARN